MLSSTHTESGPFLLLTPPHQRGGWGCARSWEGTQLGRLTPADQRDVPYHMMSCSIYKLGEKLARGHCSGQAGHRSVGGEQLFFILITCFSCILFLSRFCYSPFHYNLLLLLLLLLIFFNFNSVTKLFLSQRMGLLTFTLQTLSPIPPRRGGAGAVSERLCYLAAG